MNMDTRNSHLLVARMEAEGHTWGLVRMQVLEQPNAVGWLCATPNPRTGVHLCSQDIELCLKYRRGIQIYKERTVCHRCGKDVDTLGKHAMN